MTHEGATRMFLNWNFMTQARTLCMCTLPRIRPLQPRSRPLAFLLPRDTTHVGLELPRHIDHAHEMLHLDIHHIRRLAILQRLVTRERDGGLQRVPDLAAVPLQIRDFGVIEDVALGVAVDLDLAAVDQIRALAVLESAVSLQFPEEAVPDLLPRVVRQVVVLQHDRHSRQECVVDLAHAVGGQEEQAAEVLHAAEEDGDDAVALDVARGAPLEEDVGFVEEEDRFPALC